MKTAKPVAKKVAKPETILVLRTVGPDRISKKGFKWPKRGPVKCPDWDPKPECGHGLHGLAKGMGDALLLLIS